VAATLSARKIVSPVTLVSAAQSSICATQSGPLAPAGTQCSRCDDIEISVVGIRPPFK
jgi:hypothetical protein